MKLIRIKRWFIPIALLTVTVTSCGGPETSGAGTTISTPTLTSSALPVSTPPLASPVPGPVTSAARDGSAVSCVEWIRFEKPQDQYNSAPLVLIGKSVSRAGATNIYGSQATTHLIEVEQVLKGTLGDGSLHINSMPPTCTVSETYPEGDPLDTTERIIIFATMQGGEWYTLTPFQGTIPFPEGAELPFSLQ